MNDSRIVRNKQRIARYVASGRKNVNGWFSRIDAELFSTLMLTQIGLGVKGGVMEVGVHHGRSFIVMSLCLGEDEKAIAIDIFEQQYLNVDRSGKGNRDKFEQNLNYYEAESNVEIIAASSLDIKSDDIKKLSSGLRFVSIDGGHWFEAVLNDLRLAAACAGPECVIAIDDFFNPDFPEVSAAYYKWIGSNSDFTPLCISQGKLYIYRGKDANKYYSALNANNYLQFNRKKTARFVGKEIPIYTGRHSGVRGLIGQYTSFYAPSFHSYIKDLLHGDKYNPVVPEDIGLDALKGAEKTFGGLKILD